MKELSAQSLFERQILISLAGPIAERKARHDGAGGFRRGLAFHEAAHAAVIDFLSFNVFEISILPERLENGSLSAGSVVWGMNSTAPDPVEIRAARSFREWTDTQKIARYCWLLAPDRSKPRWKAVLTYVRAMRDRAAALIDYLWPSIDRLARRLIADDVIRQSEVRDLLRVA